MTSEEVIKKIKDNFSILYSDGLTFLGEDMPKYPSFDYLKPEEKDLYFIRANYIGIKLLQEGLHRYAVIYFDEMLKAVNEYEKKYNKKFNKGMIFGNLGVARIANGDYDTGIPSLMAGFNEDKLIAGDHERNFLNNIMYQQFEKEAQNYIVIERKAYAMGAVSGTYGHDFMESFEVDNRLYLMGIVNSLRINLEVLANGYDNKYTRGRILVALSDLCVFIEDAMKRKVGIVMGIITLKPFLRKHVFSVEPWQVEVIAKWDNLTRADTLGSLEANLKTIFAIADQNVQRFLILGAIRNFLGHNFDVDGTFLFSYIGVVEKNIFEAMFYLKDNGKL